MKELSQWLSEYGEHHQNPINQKIHQISVPGIFLSVVGLIWSLPSIELYGLVLNWVWLAAIPLLIFYYRLSLSAFLLMLGFVLACISLIWSIELMQVSVLLVSLALFSVFWSLQFIGHKIEGKSPSFFKDVQYLLIGPIWALRKR